MHFKEVEFPQDAAKQIQSLGGKPVKALSWSRHGSHVFVLVSDEPSGENGAIERHMSVSASMRGVVIGPSKLEVHYACEAIGWRYKDCEIANGTNCVHVYNKKHDAKSVIVSRMAECPQMLTDIERRLETEVAEDWQ